MTDSAADIHDDDKPKRKPVAKKTKVAAKAAPVEAAPEKPAKAAKAPAKAKGKASKGSEAELPLTASEPAENKPARAAKSPEPASKPAPSEAPAPQVVPVFKVPGDESAAKPAGGNRHEAVEFDPSAIFARFAPKPEESKPAEPAAEPAENRSQSEPARERDTPVSEENSQAGEPGAEPKPGQGERPQHPQRQDRDRPQNGDRQQDRPRHPNDRPQHGGQQNGGQQQGRHPNDRQQQGGQQQGRHPNDRQNGGGHQNGGQQGRHPNDRQQQGGRPGDNRNPKFQQPRKQWPGLADTDTAEEHELALGEAFNYNSLNDAAVLEEQAKLTEEGEPYLFNELYAASMNEIVGEAKNLGLKLHRTPQRRELVGVILEEIGRQKRAVRLTGTLELLEDGNGLLVYGFDNYRVRELSAFVPKLLIKRHGLLRGHEVEALALPARAGETAPMVVKVLTVMGAEPEEVMRRTPFTELTPYYPTKRMMLETDNMVGWDNLSMRCVDLLCPIGLGQRGLIVAPPRTGKTVLMQAMANSIARNNPDVHLMVLLVDERPEEVTDFRRNTKANEVVSSTFDENAESHVHAAEMVIERARRMVEGGRHVVILLDSITRLARAYNTMVPSSGKILSGGIEAGALTRPKRFFGSARNIEGGGSLTILGTALVDTGSKMDEVIFEEFKGTGNMELDLDRDLANKRIFPAINFERSGTRKEELLYHPEEMMKIYALRRAMKGVPSAEAMEMLIQRVKKTKTNAEFLVTLSR